MTEMVDGTWTATYSLSFPDNSQFVTVANGLTEYSYGRLIHRTKATPQVNTTGSNPYPVLHRYRYNAANQRTQVDLWDGSYWEYGYDPLGQLVSGRKYWSDGSPVAGQQFEYGFDDIGNRKRSARGGDAQG